eukprot:2823471-Amphidinium_carterae.1
MGVATVVGKLFRLGTSVNNSKRLASSSWEDQGGPQSTIFESSLPFEGCPPRVVIPSDTMRYLDPHGSDGWNRGCKH